MEKNVIAFLSSITKVDEADIDTETSLSELGIDSVSFVRIMAQFESQFNVKISSQEMADIYSVEDLINLVKNNK